MEKITDKIRAIITGSTGMVGEGVMHECLQHPDVEEVLVINRRPCSVIHPKLKEIVHNDFFDITSIADQLSGYNACYFCLGVTSVGKKEPEYHRLTYALTLHIAEILAARDPDMTFCYVSGSGTDSTEKGGTMWARVKGKTENDLMKLRFKQVYAFRPGYIHPIKGLQRTHGLYKALSWMYPLFKIIFPNGTCTLHDLGLAMINVALYGYEKKVINNKDIAILGRY